ncbi:hypothetical protein PENTCL1PPCAC_19598 [Pristionchus entomophagus]|uniref:Ribosomal protein n=1 Tax=Pristionchus entomophagus TaxID=358040 RepID=A0AAV5TSF4_9BILA|nr:hypothetical protein PENTCL1PPCAC_19598 [Pristionchus entomophagus]
MHSLPIFSPLIGFLYSATVPILTVYSQFSSTIHSAIDLFVPFRTPRPPSLSYPPHIVRLIRHRDLLFAKIHIPSIKPLFHECIAKWTRYSTRKKLSRINDLYRHVASITKPKLSIPELVSPLNVPVYDSISKANILVSEFATHFTLDDGCIQPLSSSPIPPSLSLFTIFPHEVHKALRKLSPSCATGHDGIPQIIFSKCAYALSTPLADIFNRLISGTSYLDSSSDRSTDPLFLALTACVQVLKVIHERFLQPVECPIEVEKSGRSIVVENLAESSRSLPSERLTDDYAPVTKFLDMAGVEVRPETVFRMGERKQGKPRPLKILLPRTTA